MDPLSLVYLGILGGGFTLGFFRVLLYRRSRKMRNILLERSQQQETFRPEQVEMLEDPNQSRTAIEWRTLSLPDPTGPLTKPPSQEPPEGEDAVVGEEGREELEDLREKWIGKNVEEFDRGAESIHINNETPDEIEIVDEDDDQEGDFAERIEREGAKTGEVQVTLLWNNYNDLDLHLFCPSGERIYFNNRNSECGGELDIDMNIKPGSRKPIENVYWEVMPPVGDYRICVHHYAKHRRWKTKDPTKFKVRVRIGEKVKQYKGKISKGDPMKTINTFTISNHPDQKKDAWAED